MNKKQRLLVFVLGIFSLFLFAALSYFVHKGFFKQIDFNLTVKLQDHISRRFDSSFSVFSLLGSVEATGVIFLIIMDMLNHGWFACAADDLDGAWVFLAGARDVRVVAELIAGFALVEFAKTGGLVGKADGHVSGVDDIKRVGD